MQDSIAAVANICLFSPLLGSFFAGFASRYLSNLVVQTMTIVLLGFSLISAIYLANIFIIGAHTGVDINLYQWLNISPLNVKIGYWLDSLSCVMLLVVTSVSFLVHIYSIGYMHGEQGYSRFFSYMSLFTFMMLALVMSNNMIGLFFGWEGVGLVSYLLIGFYYKKDSAVNGAFKAFLVNRIGDVAFILGIAVVVYTVGSVQFADIFAVIEDLIEKNIHIYGSFSLTAAEAIALLWFIGAMSKSAQIPLHVWLPESMEGPTPISALIHAATMVTAGVYMMCRFATMYEHILWLNNIIACIGASGALWLGLVAIVQDDIKRVIAYSTLSQLGYMVVAIGVGAYSLAIFHLLTHAFFKSLLFLAAGSVIVALDHEQNMFKMGGLYKKMPITMTTFLIGAISLSAFWPFAGFFSKDAIISAVSFQMHNLSAGWYIHMCVVIGAFVTPLYIFRAFFLTFYGEDVDRIENVRESSSSIIWPLILLSIPSIMVGYFLSQYIASGDFFHNSMDVKTVFALSIRDYIYHELESPFGMLEHSFKTLVVYFSFSGVVVAWYCYYYRPIAAEIIFKKMPLVYWVLKNKFGFDYVYENIFLRIFLFMSRFFYWYGDKYGIDFIVENGFAKDAVRISRVMRILQTGYLSHYLVLMLAVIVFWVFFVFI